MTGLSAGNGILGLDSPLFDGNSVLVSAGLDDKDIVVLDLTYYTGDTADGGDGIADFNGSSHLLSFLFLLSLRSDHEEVEKNYDKNDGENGSKSRNELLGGSKFYDFFRGFSNFSKENEQFSHKLVHLDLPPGI